MLGIGIITLFSIGLVGMMGGGGDDVVVEEEQSTVDDTSFEQGDKNLLDDVDVDLGKQEPATPKDAPDTDAAEDQSPQADVPQDDTPTTTAPETDADTDTTQDDADTETAPPVRPPFGDDYFDARAFAEAADAQRILDEIAAAEARLPVNLVTVSGDFGAEVADDVVLNDAPGTTDPNDAEFIVTAPDTPNEISVGYDHEHTFDINYSSETTTITAALNSNIQGPDGTDVTTVTDEVDDNDVPYTQTSLTKTFEGSTDITLEVTEDQIGSQISQIDLSNPADTLHFEFDNETDANYHLVFNEVEQGDSGDTNVIKSAYIVQSDADIDLITAAEIAEAMRSGVNATGTGTVLAEIFLGEDGLKVSGDADTGEDYALEITNSINDAPQITANVDWSSETSHEDILVSAQTVTNSGVAATANGGSVSGGGSADGGGSTGGGSDNGSGIADSDFRGLGQLYNAAFGLINQNPYGG